MSNWKTDESQTLIITQTDKKVYLQESKSGSYCPAG